MKPVVEAVQQGLGNNSGGDARRLFHGRGQCFPGLGFINVDWYRPVLLLSLIHISEPTRPY